MPDSLAVAILTRLDALAARHGLRPYDFVARVTPGPGGAGSQWVLEFGDPPADPAKAERFARLLAALGVSRPEFGVARGGVAALLDALDAALGTPQTGNPAGTPAPRGAELSPGCGAPAGGGVTDDPDEMSLACQPHELTG